MGVGAPRINRLHDTSPAVQQTLPSRANNCHTKRPSSCRTPILQHVPAYAPKSLSRTSRMQRWPRVCCASEDGQALQAPQPILYVAKSPLAGMTSVLRMVSPSQIPAELAHWMLLIRDPVTKTCTVLDFLPQDPLATQTAMQLLTGRTVQGAALLTPHCCFNCGYVYNLKPVWLLQVEYDITSSAATLRSQGTSWEPCKRIGKMTQLLSVPRTTNSCTWSRMTAKRLLWACLKGFLGGPRPLWRASA